MDVTDTDESTINENFMSTETNGHSDISVNRPFMDMSKDELVSVCHNLERTLKYRDQQNEETNKHFDDVMTLYYENIELLAKKTHELFVCQQQLRTSLDHIHQFDEQYKPEYIGNESDPDGISLASGPDVELARLVNDTPDSEDSVTQNESTTNTLDQNGSSSTGDITHTEAVTADTMSPGSEVSSNSRQGSQTNATSSRTNSSTSHLAVQHVPLDEAIEETSHTCEPIRDAVEMTTEKEVPQHGTSGNTEQTIGNNVDLPHVCAQDGLNEPNIKCEDSELPEGPVSENTVRENTTLPIGIVSAVEDNETNDTKVDVNANEEDAHLCLGLSIADLVDNQSADTPDEMLRGSMTYRKDFPETTPIAKMSQSRLHHSISMDSLGNTSPPTEPESTEGSNDNSDEYPVKQLSSTLPTNVTQSAARVRRHAKRIASSCTDLSGKCYPVLCRRNSKKSLFSVLQSNKEDATKISQTEKEEADAQAGEKARPSSDTPTITNTSISSTAGTVSNSATITKDKDIKHSSGMPLASIPKPESSSGEAQNHHRGHEMLPGMKTLSPTKSSQRHCVLGGGTDVENMRITQRLRSVARYNSKSIVVASEFGDRKLVPKNAKSLDLKETGLPPKPSSRRLKGQPFSRQEVPEGAVHEKRCPVRSFMSPSFSPRTERLRVSKVILSERDSLELDPADVQPTLAS